MVRGWNTGSACSTSAASFSVAPSGSRWSAEGALLDSPAQLSHAIARGRGPLGEGIRAPQRFAALASPEQGVDEVGLEGEVELGRGHERGGALEQAHGGAVVRPELRAAAGGGQAAPRRRGQAAVVGGIPSSAR